MKIYLAGGVNLTTLKGWHDLSTSREWEVCKMFPTWKRVYSFYYLANIYKSKILKIVKNENLKNCKE